MLRYSAAVVSVFALLTGVGCQSPYAGDRLAATGAVLGGLGGAAIGSQSGKALPGAAIGAALGTIGGAAIGDSIDEQAARNRAVIEQRVGRQMSGRVTHADVVAMSAAGLGDQVIITHIRAHGVAQPVDAQSLIMLKQNGVSDGVLAALQNPGPPPLGHVQPTHVIERAGPPVVIRERVYGPPPRWRHYYRCGPPPRRPGWAVGFSVGN